MYDGDDVLDVAIIGAGVSGAYCAYRLTQDTDKSVGVFEANNRVGGRLWSHHWEAADAMVELGGEAFSPVHAIVAGLVGAELGLKVVPHQAFNTLNRMYLRNTLLSFEDLLKRSSFPTDGTIAEKAKVRYFVGDHYFQPQSKKNPDDIPDPFESVANHFLDRLSPKVGIAFGKLITAYSTRIDQLCPNGVPLTADLATKVVTSEIYERISELIASLEAATVEVSPMTQALLGKKTVPAYDLDFWSMIVSDLGQEVYELFRNAGYDNTSAMGLNFVELMENLLLGSLMGATTPGFWSLEGGFDTLPKTLIARARKSGAELCLEHHLSGVTRDQTSGKIELHFTDSDGQKIVRYARKLIVSAPVSSFDSTVSLDGFDPDMSIAFARRRKGLISIPAGKLYLVYPEPWWQDLTDLPESANKLYGYANTDMPTRAVYYKGYCGDGIRGLMTGALTDSISAEFWTSFLSPDAALFPGSDEDRRRQFGAPVHMVGAGHQILRKMHRDLLQKPMPIPELAIYHEWRLEGGGWSAWKSGRDIHKEARRLRTPFTNSERDEGLYCCGDSVAERHGWVEDVLESAELMLREAFGLKTARWIPGKQTF